MCRDPGAVLVVVAAAVEERHPLYGAAKTAAVAASRNLGDKSEGAKTSRTGRDKGELAGLNKRLTSTTGKAARKNTSGLMKDAKMSDSTTSLLEIKLKEESDLGSADCSFSETDESQTSEEGSKSPSGEFTVRKVRQRKFVKSRSGSQEGSENTASMSSRTLRWDYSGIGLADTPTVGNQGPANDNNESDLGASAGGIGNSGNTHAMGTESGILQSMYSSIKELQTETKIESRRARVVQRDCRDRSVR
ncbi:hypothetical protein NDU88_000052 [Pleurodeles waltl]|uniref:Uncharacterized protein n=1 Tax=Pleurodeles waltl TaxID=8319 RepID=A0AAV7KS84_PLEWA|nr:hypothetical protein NDU88_000052 [Pleurodeles waltl]